MEHAYLSEVFPKYKNTIPHIKGSLLPISLLNDKQIRRDFPGHSSQEQCSSDPPEYTTNENKFIDLAPGQKLRIVNGALEIDTRKFQSIRRRYTKDSRYTILEKIFEEPMETRNHILDILRVTYAKDKKWIEASYKNIKS